MIRKSRASLLIVGFVAVLLLFTVSCQKKVPVGPTPEEIAEQQKAAADAAKARADAEAAAKAEAEAKAAAAKAKADAEAEAAREAQEAMDAVTSEKVYFDYDSSELKPASQEILTKKAEWLKENGDYKLKIEGNCDERGSTEYNLALGARRAEAAAKFISALGVSSDRLTTVSYGEEKPIALGHNEAAWAQNRRDEFVLSK